jgi:AcrR family transcriptional regulator
MKQAEKTKRSRELILEAALKLFSSQGYRATSVRDIAADAGLSTGNVYHHFSDKETIFRRLLDQFWKAIDDPDLPFNKVLVAETFPDNLEEIGHVARQLVQDYRRSIALLYVDVVELDGSHIRRLCSEMARRISDHAATHGDSTESGTRLREGVAASSAVMLASRLFLSFFAVEILFGVSSHSGKKTDEVVREIADILRFGMARTAPTLARRR